MSGMDFGQLQQMMSAFQNEGIRGILLKPMFPTDNGGMVSQAQVLADVINIYRMDAKMFADIHGVDLSIKKITAERVATMLSDMVEGEPVAMIETFNGIEALHNEVFEEVLTDEQFAAYDEGKHSELYSWTAEPVDQEAVAADSLPELDDDAGVVADVSAVRELVAAAQQDEGDGDDQQDDLDEGGE